MSSRPVQLLLEDIVESIEKIENYAVDLDKDGFFKDEKTIDAVVRNLEIIGEAANRLPVDFTSQHQGTEWRRIIGLRHRIVHDYFGIDLEIIWEIIKNELGPLKQEMSKIKEIVENEEDFHE